MAIANECPERIRSLLASLQIPLDLVAARLLVLQEEADDLVVAELGEDGREHMLVPAARRPAIASITRDEQSM